MACDSLITPSSKSASTCFRITLCFSSECLRGGARFHGSRHLSSSITIFICSTAAGFLRTLAITSIQLSITMASILFKILSDFVTSLNKVKSNTTVPYIEWLNCVPAKPTSDVGMDVSEICNPRVYDYRDYNLHSEISVGPWSDQISLTWNVSLCHASALHLQLLPAMYEFRYEVT